MAFSRRKRALRAKAPVKRRTRRFPINNQPGSIHIEAGRIRMMLPGRLKSLNQLKTGLSRYGDTKAWEARIKKARLAADDHTVALPVTSRARLEIARISPSGAVLDFVNLEGGTKGLEDALKRCGYIMDDSPQWLDRKPSQQLMSPDRQYWAMLTITVLED